ncbi:hypothetical protein NXF25_013649, partial [Crotalus adamanteus]
SFSLSGFLYPGFFLALCRQIKNHIISSESEASISQVSFLGEAADFIMEEHNSSAESPLLSPGRHTAIKCGWLRKQGGFVKTWHTRWFVLKGEQLYYFKDEDEAKPLPT